MQQRKQQERAREPASAAHSPRHGSEVRANVLSPTAGSRAQRTTNQRIVHLLSKLSGVLHDGAEKPHRQQQALVYAMSILQLISQRDNLYGEQIGVIHRVISSFVYCQDLSLLRFLDRQNELISYQEAARLLMERLAKKDGSIGALSDDSAELSRRLQQAQASLQEQKREFESQLVQKFNRMTREIEKTQEMHAAASEQVQQLNEQLREKHRLVQQLQSEMRMLRINSEKYLEFIQELSHRVKFGTRDPNISDEQMEPHQVLKMLNFHRVVRIVKKFKFQDLVYTSSDEEIILDDEDD